MNRIMFRAAAASIFLLGGLTIASPAAACLQTLQVRFAPGDTEIVDKEAIAGFLSVSSYGARQKIIVRVSGPLHDLARRRALALASLLQGYGLLSSGIMIESDKRPEERAVIIVYPPPRSTGDQLASAAPRARPTCGW